MAEPPQLSVFWCRSWQFIALIALVWLIAARVFGPSDLWDQTQPKTVSYTTDIVVNHHWVLPVERGLYPATKPPLYNWVAAPFVKAMGFSSEIAHKMPSLIALFLCWALLMQLVRKIDHRHRGALGPLAAIALVACYPVFKLGYLARPDMLLTLICFVGWLVAVRILLRARNDSFRPTAGSRLLAFSFWICVALAALTKGPAAILLPIAAFSMSRVLTGRWLARGALAWRWGLPLCLIIAGSWIFAVWLVNPEHLREELWFNEFYGRVMGTGPEGRGGGFVGWITSLGHMPGYFMIRFAPWSVGALAALFALCSRKFRDSFSEVDREHLLPWIQAAVVYVVVVIVLFSLSTGKRADYLAPALPPAALLASWWMLSAKPYLGVRIPWAGPLIAIISLGAMTYINEQEKIAPKEGFGDSIMEFARTANHIIAAKPAPIVCWDVGASHLQAMVGCSVVDGKEQVHQQLLAGEPFWLLAGQSPSTPFRFQTLLTIDNSAGQLTFQTESDRLPRDAVWPEVVRLFRVEPLTVQQTE